MKKLLIQMVGISSVVFTSSAYAVNIGQIKGEHKNFTSPSGKVESCIVADKLLPDLYSKSDIKSEQELCGIDFYRTHAICPKLNSTNPGVLIEKILEGKTREETMKVCATADLSTEAKFKNSISCSYTPSILAYYHFSNILGTNNVPVATIRTIDRDEHKRVGLTALELLSGKSGDIITANWRNFTSQHSSLGNSNLFDSSTDFVYGALSENPKREYKYTEVSGVGSYETRYERFLQQPPFKKVANTSSVQSIAGSSSFGKIMPVLKQMKDVSDMILLDTLFNQDDRIGNIHYKMNWYSLEQNAETKVFEIKKQKSKASLSSDKKSWVIPEDEKALQAKGAVLIRDMLLKDNDCGVDLTKRSNKMRSVDALEQIRHMSAKTYRRFISFYKIARNAETVNWMKNSLLMSDKEIGSSRPMNSKSFLANLDKAYSILNTNCKNGSLLLDLNMEDYIPGATPMSVSCD